MNNRTYGDHNTMKTNEKRYALGHDKGDSEVFVQTVFFEVAPLYILVAGNKSNRRWTQ